uniref:Tyrosine-protein phosphatase domain-containing protein n=1 Tax=Strongyloides stercoralis TaxID=6248 RepID=A0A0K0EQF7_STRER
MSNNNNSDWLADFNLLNEFIPDTDAEKKSNSFETEQKVSPVDPFEMEERNPFEEKKKLKANGNNKNNKKSDSKMTLSSESSIKAVNKEPQPSTKPEEGSVMAIEDRNDIKTKLKQLDAFSTYILDKEIDGLKEEYKTQIATIIPKPDEIKTFLKFEGLRKNRNLTAPCYDHSRVTLKEEGIEDNYVNASYINTLDGKKRYICSQAPLDNTVVDFWKMIIQENVEVIVMLCEFIEDKKKKCSEYIPLKIRSSICFDNMAVYLIKREIMEKDKNVVVNHLSVKKGKKELLIKHYTWKNWPKVGCPSVSSTSMYIYASIYKSKNPILVHCASGIRRSPIFIMIAMFMDCVNETKVENEILLKLAKHIRMARAGALTSEIDYIYVARVLLQRFLDRKLIVPSQKMLEFFDDYDPALKKAQKLEAERITEMTIGPMPVLATNNKDKKNKKVAEVNQKLEKKK